MSRGKRLRLIFTARFTMDRAIEERREKGKISVANLQSDRTAPINQKRRFLIVGTYAGGFFRLLATSLRAEGADVYRIGLTGGDLMQWRTSGFINYAGRLEHFSDFLDQQHHKLGLTDLIVFGDTTFYNKAAVGWARKHGLNLHVLENGYFRPTWVTLEHEGVNALSSLPRDPEFYRREGAPLSLIETLESGTITSHLVMAHFRYYWWYLVFRPFYWRYSYPLTQAPLSQLFRSSYRYLKLRLTGLKQHYQRVEQDLLEMDRPFYLAFLQREGDSSIIVHADLKTNPAFIETVVESFARHAPANHLLVVKNHPLDPYVYNLAKETKRCAARHGVADRVVFLDGGSFPELTRKAAGAVTVNSSAAIAAMGFETPTKILGRAFFDIEGLTAPEPLDEFWTCLTKPDKHLFTCFQKYVRHHVQVQGSFQNPEMRGETAQRLAERMMAYRNSERPEQ